MRPRWLSGQSAGARRPVPRGDPPVCNMESWHFLRFGWTLLQETDQHHVNGGYMTEGPVIESEIVNLSDTDSMEIGVADSGAISLEASVKEDGEVFSLQLLTRADKIDSLIAALLRAKERAQ